MADKVVLLLEDEAIVAMDVGQTLEEEGYCVVATMGTCSAALKWLAENPPPTMAIVDVNLADGPCHKVVEELIAKDVPFVVHTASMALTPQDDVFRAGVWLSKPANTQGLREAIRRAVAR